MAIIGYIAEDNPVAAQALLEEIESKVGRLPEHPKRCRPGRVEGTRELVRILRVLHAAQMWP
jgi:plasmid stabilization system protein ParE